jgi:hypothetical protein
VESVRADVAPLPACGHDLAPSDLQVSRNFSKGINFTGVEFAAVRGKLFGCHLERCFSAAGSLPNVRLKAWKKVNIETN